MKWSLYLRDFSVDASSAGVGNLEVAVNEGRIPSMAHALGQHKYDISFVPKESTDHTISVRFNNEPVPGYFQHQARLSIQYSNRTDITGSPFISRLATSTLQVTASGPGLERVPIEEPVEIWVNIASDQPASGPPEVIVTDSKGTRLNVEVTPQSNERFMAVYIPRSVGNHHVDISYGGDPIHGTACLIERIF